MYGNREFTCMYGNEDLPVCMAMGFTCMHGNEDSPTYDDGNLDVWQWQFTWMYGNSMNDNEELPVCMAIGSLPVCMAMRIFLYVWQWGLPVYMAMGFICLYGNGVYLYIWQ